MQTDPDGVHATGLPAVVSGTELHASAHRGPTSDFTFVFGSPSRVKEYSQFAEEFCPSGWKRHINPAGEPYFQRRTKSLTLVTPSDICDQKILDAIEQVEDDFHRTVAEKGVEVPGKWELCLEWNDEEPLQCSFVHHDSLRIYSIKFDENDPFCLCDTPGAYWQYIARFPTHLYLPQEVLEDFMSAVAHGAAERVLYDKETVFPFTDRQCERLMRIYQDLLNNLKTMQGRTNSHVLSALNCHIATAMEIIADSRKKYKYGTPEARTHRDLPDKLKPTKTLRLTDIILTVILLGMHTTYRQRMANTRTKGEVNIADFQKLLAGFMQEWGDSNLLATVFVSANVAFLAVPGITGIQKTASLASTLLGMMSILGGVHHIWRHRSKLDDNIDGHIPGKNTNDAEEFLGYLKYFDEDAKLTVLASFLSLPIVCLLWAVVSFIVAVGAYCIQGMAAAALRLLASLIGVLGLAAIGTIVFFWSIWGERPPYIDDKEDDENDEGSALWAILERVQHSLRGRLQFALWKERLWSFCKEHLSRGRSNGKSSSNEVQSRRGSILA